MSGHPAHSKADEICERLQETESKNLFSKNFQTILNLVYNLE